MNRKEELTSLKKADIPILLVLGRPGTQKSTYCKKLAEKYEFTHMSCGELLRNEVKRNPSKDEKLEKALNEGKLAHTDIVMRVLKEALLKELKDSSKGFIIDGFPRNVRQRKHFEKEIQTVEYIIYFDVPEKTTLEILKKQSKTSGGSKEVTKVNKKRLKTFKSSTIPVVDYYEKKKKLIKIKVEGTEDEIVANAVKQLDKVLQKRSVTKKPLEAESKKKSTEVIPVKEESKEASAEPFNNQKTPEPTSNDTKQALHHLHSANIPIFFIIGAPGAGKGTQCEMIVAKYGLCHISSSNLLRNEIKSSTARGERISKIMQTGESVSQDIIFDILKEAIVKEVAKGSKGFLLDDYPREIKQGEQFEKEIQEAKSVIFFDVSDRILVERLLKRGKTGEGADVNMESIKKRLQAYATVTAPVLDYYEKKNKLIKIKAHGTVKEIFAEVTKNLDTVLEGKAAGAPIDEKQIALNRLKKANLPVFFIAGGPGSGKGTQCAKLVEKYGLSHLSSGDLLREEIKSGSPRGAELTKIMRAGKLVPLEIVLDLLKEAMLKEVSKGSKGFLIDGYPREVKQGEQFENEIQEADLVIFFDVSDEILTERVLKRAKTSGRADDNMDSMKKRLKTFSAVTAPVIDYYEKKKKLIKIKANGSVEEIFAEVVKHIDPILSRKTLPIALESKKIDLTPLKKANLPIFFIAGGPGSGKGTQCAKLVEKYGLSHLSSGDLLRDEVKSGSPRGAELAKIMKAGKLVPLEIVLDLVKEAMLKEVSKGSKGFLIDGYPREVKQGEQFENEIQEADLVIFFDVSDEVLTERVLKRAKTSGRADDNMDSMKKRLKTFSAVTAPVIDYYKKKKKLVRIKANGSIEEIFGEVVKNLDPILNERAALIERKKIDLTPLKKARLPIIFIAGGPGSGKGTQCAKLVEKYGLSHLSSGDLLRDEVKSGSPMGAELTKIMKAGKLVPLGIVLDLVKEAMLKEVSKGSKGFLIDGYPREVKQGEQFEDEIQEANLVIFFDVSDDVLTERVLKRAKTSGRADDNMESMKKRLKTFNTATAPVIDYYEKKNKLLKIKANGTIEQVFAEVVKHLDTILNKNVTAPFETRLKILSADNVVLKLVSGSLVVVGRSVLMVDRRIIDLTPLRRAKVSIFFVIGAPGAGKGTQCEKMVSKFGLSHLSPDDLLRDEAKSGSPIGEELNRMMKAGELVPSEFVLDLIKEAIIKAVNSGTKGILLDGYPLKLKQGEEFEKEVQEAKSVIFFDATEEISLERLLKRAKTSGCGDENIECIKKRIETFKKTIAPVIDYYEKKNKLIKIMAKGTIEEIFALVENHLNSLMG